jgi:hypothetical protein
MKFLNDNKVYVMFVANYIDLAKKDELDDEFLEYFAQNSDGLTDGEKYAINIIYNELSDSYNPYHDAVSYRGGMYLSNTLLKLSLTNDQTKEYDKVINNMIENIIKYDLKLSDILDFHGLKDTAYWFETPIGHMFLTKYQFVYNNGSGDIVIQKTKSSSYINGIVIRGFEDVDDFNIFHARIYATLLYYLSKFNFDNIYSDVMSVDIKQLVSKMKKLYSQR